MNWLIHWCKEKPTVFLNIINGSIKQLTEDNDRESVRFLLEDFISLKFKSRLCICKHEYLKLNIVTLFNKLIEHNFINKHDFYLCLELIGPGTLKSNMSIVKLFINNINSFAIEERITLGPNSRLNMHESEDKPIVILQQQIQYNATELLTPNVVVNLPENT